MFDLVQRHVRTRTRKWKNEQSVGDCHRGARRYRSLERIQEITAKINSSGALNILKGQADAADTSEAYVRTHSLYTERRPFKKVGQYSVFEPEKVAIKNNDGAIVAERERPRAAFAGHTLHTPWDDLHLVYFRGYAIWEYLTTPFLFKMPGFQSEEIDKWEGEGETWRRLKVIFPDSVPSHCTEQIFYFDRDAMLRRHDYSAYVTGGTDAANYASDYVSFDGIKLPTKRRVYRRDSKNMPVKDTVLVSIDIENLRAI